MKINVDGILPISFAKISQLGMKIALGLEGYPSNRMIMCYGPPGGGKSSLLFQIAGEYIRNGDEVWIIDSERAIDRVYLASYIPIDLTEETKIEALKYYQKISESFLKKTRKEEEPAVSAETLEIIQRRIETIPQIIDALRLGTEPAIGKRRANSILLNALTEYRLRDVKILHHETLEEFERETIKALEERKEDPERRHKRLLIGVDSISYLLPEEVLERVACSEGSNFATAKYLHTLLPKLITKLSGTETSIFFIHQKTTTIKMNPWEHKSPIDDVATKGGSAAKFGATTMIGVERRKRVKSIITGTEVDTGIIEIPKAKLRAGSKGTLRGMFYLKESVEKSVMDFNEPFIMGCLLEERYGIRKARGSRYYVPKDLLEGHPDYQTKIRPNLTTFPKEENGEAIYFTEEEAVLLRLLEESPSFEEIVLFDYGILSNV